MDAQCCSVMAGCLLTPAWRPCWVGLCDQRGSEKASDLGFHSGAWSPFRTLTSTWHAGHGLSALADPNTQDDMSGFSIKILRF